MDMNVVDVEKYNKAIMDSNLIYGGSIIMQNPNIYDYKEEKDNSVTYGYNVAGIRVKCDEIWNNKYKELSLRFYGEAEILCEKTTYERKLRVDTDVYDKYDWYVKDGILYVTLFEKINERPNFSRVEKAKKDKTKPTKEDKESIVERD